MIPLIKELKVPVKTVKKKPEPPSDAESKSILCYVVYRY